MTVIQGFILGIIQGLSEFLPISSSGHLVLFQKLFGLKEGVVTFDIALHLATLIAVIVVLWKDALEIIRKPLSKMTFLIIAGTIPTFIIGAAFSDLFEKLFESGISLGFEFILTGLVLWYADSVRSKNKGLEKTTYIDAAIIGVAQGIAILPAVSRSGFTIAGALFRGLNREFALKFSFLMSVPAILGAAAKDFYDIIKAGNGLEIGVGMGPLLIGMLAAAVSGYLAIRFMLKVFTKVSLKVFSYYVFILGAIVLVDQIFFGKFFGRLF
ncbi:undecaprenyl-diphosphate phosphatase [Candidatus Parcubacteria bacterium]|nr:MAG: undecaprenyl-diphosphate phosphatase [Candidatus Parcubacteria bacterium]